MPHRLASFFAAVLLAVAPCSAQTLRVSLQDLAGASDAVVFGRTIATESYWVPDSSAILTRVVIETEDPETGENRGVQVVTVPGGRVGDYLHEVSDMAVFVPDEEVVVFLERHPSGATIVAGGVQGKLRLVRNSETGARSIEGAEHLLREERLATPEDRGAIVEGELPQAALPVGEFIARLKNLGIDP